MLLIGSVGLNFHLLEKKECKDYDIICKYDEYEKWIKTQKIIKACYPTDNGDKIIVKTDQDIFEFEISWDDNDLLSEFIGLVEVDEKTSRQIIGFEKLKIDNVMIPSLDVLYTIKMSHRFLKNSPHFLKTKQDIKTMRELGASIPEKYREWLLKREKTTYKYPHPKLNQTKSDFFDTTQGVKYVYDHDSIHQSVAQLDKPAYTFFKDDEKEVFCSKKKFFNLPIEIRLYSVLEECYVLALERSQIPFNGTGISPRKSFLIALEKVCTSISSGWWREFAYNYYDEVLKLYDEKYVSDFWEDVDKGLVKKGT